MVLDCGCMLFMVENMVIVLLSMCSECLILIVKLMWLGVLIRVSWCGGRLCGVYCVCMVVVLMVMLCLCLIVEKLVVVLLLCILLM